MVGLKCCGRRKRRKSEESLSPEANSNTDTPKKNWPLWKKILVWSLVSLASLIVIAFLLIWVGVPVTFWLSIAFQRFIVFIPVASPKNPDFTNPESYGIKGARNFYIAVTDLYDSHVIAQIGAWLILPDEYKDSDTTGDISETIRKSDFDILIYLHGVAANRAKPIAQYEVLRKNFLVIAVDHRGYGDSGPNVEMTERGIVNDHLQIYDWVMRKNFTKNIYYWGHSLGAALSCHTVRALKEQRNVVPKGLVLESAFTTYAEEVVNIIVGKIFKWLPYFEATVLNPLDYNGFHFHSTTNILHVDCPIMMLHAEDDSMIPWTLGARLADVAATERDVSKQGNVTFHKFSAELGYGHNDVTQDPNIPGYITNFKEICESFTRS